ncbi:urea carboxylase-associated family protein [Mycobacterium manitobense]|uniref:Urea carboxylase-associated family protein n=1 Tax=[Mycobacterium] manitobense TaxID=190147 RepID=A0A9X2YLC3_9MYCO|nr:urea carboxylase-associated family protein [[Mycobacterium] manitobense]MCV7169234.1 urea carboxylase-associated family protein [[Mycobacterium] manitobense]
MELTNTNARRVVPAGTGRAVRLARGARLRVVDLEGGQVGDLFAFVADDPEEHLSASHTRTSTGRLFPRAGEHFVTTRRRPILTLIEDTSPGVHDMLIAACDAARYRALGAPHHPSCADNLRTALTSVDLHCEVVPQPVNVFMNIPVSGGGELRWLPAVSRPGDSVTFEAELTSVVVVSACPMDLNSINGERPTALALEITPPNHATKEET